MLGFHLRANVHNEYLLLICFRCFPELIQCFVLQHHYRLGFTTKCTIEKMEPPTPGTFPASVFLSLSLSVCLPVFLRPPSLSHTNTVQLIRRQLWSLCSTFGITNQARLSRSFLLLLLLKCSFTSTEIVGLLGTGAQDGHLDFHTAPELCEIISRWNSQRTACTTSRLEVCILAAD